MQRNVALSSVPCNEVETKRTELETKRTELNQLRDILNLYSLEKKEESKKETITAHAVQLQEVNKSEKTPN